MTDFSFFFSKGHINRLPCHVDSATVPVSYSCLPQNTCETGADERLGESRYSEKTTDSEKKYHDRSLSRVISRIGYYMCTIKAFSSL